MKQKFPARRATGYSQPTRVAVVCYGMWGEAAWQVIMAVLRHYSPKPDLGALPLSLPAMECWIAHGLTVAAVAGVLATGRNIGRILFYVVALGDIVDIIFLHLASEPSRMLAYPIARIVLGSWFLLTPRASRYFKGHDPNRENLKTSRKLEAAEHTLARQDRGKYEY